MCKCDSPTGMRCINSSKGQGMSQMRKKSWKYLPSRHTSFMMYLRKTYMKAWYTRGLWIAQKHHTCTLMRWPFCIPAWLDNGDLTMPNLSYLNHISLECPPPPRRNTVVTLAIHPYLPYASHGNGRTAVSYTYRTSTKAKNNQQIPPLQMNTSGIPLY